MPFIPHITAYFVLFSVIPSDPPLMVLPSSLNSRSFVASLKRESPAQRGVSSSDRCQPASSSVIRSDPMPPESFSGSGSPHTLSVLVLEGPISRPPSRPHQVLFGCCLASTYRVPMVPTLLPAPFSFPPLPFLIRVQPPAVLRLLSFVMTPPVRAPLTES